ncbi:DCL family protein [Bosea thiooxidans]|nr:DCL family protein [Bosea sp. (in: a-proteobacteria)]
MPAKPLSIGSLHFAKKGDAAAFLQAMLHRYDVGDKVGAADEQILRHALALHPEADVKVGCGITHFSVRSADFGTKCFWINRPDGTTEKFSYKACITG